MQQLERDNIEEILKQLDEEGDLFPQFQLHIVDGKLQFLGRGGFSVVYEMVNKACPDRTYALKVIGLEKHVMTSEHFRSTARLQSILSQETPYIVRIIDAKELDIEDVHLQLLLMEKGETLLEKNRFGKVSLKDTSLATEEKVLHLAMEIGEALVISHCYNIMHRDVKLENIFWNPKDSQYKLGDFGIAKLLEGENAETVVYSDGYGAPEIKKGRGAVYNERADIYSFGITLYLLLNGLKFPGADGYYANTRIQYDPEFIFPAPENASVEMTRVIRKMCSYYPEDRYQSMADALVDLAYVGTMNGVEEAGRYEYITEQLTQTYGETQKKETGEDIEEATAQDVLTENDRKLSRAERIQDKNLEQEIYRSECRKYFVILTVLVILFLKGSNIYASSFLAGGIWVLPIAIGIGLLLGHPLFLWSAAVGAGLGWYFEATGTLSFLNFFNESVLGWLALVSLVIACYKAIQMINLWSTEDVYLDEEGN